MGIIGGVKPSRNTFRKRVRGGLGGAGARGGRFPLSREDEGLSYRHSGVGRNPEARKRRIASPYKGRGRRERGGRGYWSRGAPRPDVGAVAPEWIPAYAGMTVRWARGVS